MADEHKHGLKEHIKESIEKHEEKKHEREEKKELNNSNPDGYYTNSAEQERDAVVLQAEEMIDNQP